MKKVLSFASVLAAFACHTFAEAPTPQTEFRKALTAASKENKMTFLLLGRAACGNCNATKGLISGGKIPVTAEEFVLADLNIDDAKTQGDFMRKYGKEKFGDVLPFVVVTDSHGKALASSSGGKSADAWTTLINEAKAKIAAKPSTATTTPAASAKNANWPFNKPAPKP